jgi:hypothetical protein
MVPVVTAANVPDDPADAAALRGYASALLAAAVAAIPGWVERAVADRYRQWAGEPLPEAIRADAARAGLDAAAAVEPPLRELLTTDVDAQRSNPLAILRAAVRFPTAVLRAAGVPPVARDAHAAALFPDDVYDLSPAAFADLDPTVHDPGVEWGAAKAHVVLRRRRSR